MSSLTSEILFEKFQVIEVLKKDEHAGVFLANHIYLNKKIILKVLNTQKLPDPSMVERFKREGKILAKLDHPNIIKVLDFGMSKEFFYISFEYIEGESLRHIFKTKTLSQEQKEHVMIQLLKGLDYAHKNEIIHRDIKPENIFIDKNLNVKLGDFGLALSAEDNFVTNPYSIVGTPSYMSPEQVRGAKLTPQSDIFSAGVVLIELFTGKNPFLRDNVSLTLNEIMAYDENEIVKQTEDQQQLIKDIFFRMLRKNISQRYDSAEQILDELNVHVDQPTIVIDNVDREGKKSKLAWTLIIIIFVGIASIFIIPLIMDQQNRKSLIPETEQGNILSENNSPGSNTAEKLNRDAGNLLNTDKSKEPTAENKNQESVSNQKEDSAPNQINAVGTGWIDIKTYPLNADISISGESYGKTPFDRSFPIRTGEYTITFKHPNYPTYFKTVTVEADRITQVNVNLETETMGFLYCEVFPLKGEIFINGVKKTELPMRSTDFIKVAPGPVRLVIRNSNFKDIDTLFSVNVKDTLHLRFKFKSE
ncbi:MAG: hypothetical protein CVV24_06655 [Ignavibacteriae bacterium HGW-Ignavibacteriae-3]|nr:MAG: hypothetical protein CVV24_06655 [Ignavibacteriae bacterium HGW-Ignavibacteriae-3]